VYREPWQGVFNLDRREWSLSSNLLELLCAAEKRGRIIADRDVYRYENGDYNSGYSYLIS